MKSVPTSLGVHGTRAWSRPATSMAVVLVALALVACAPSPSPPAAQPAQGAASIPTASTPANSPAASAPAPTEAPLDVTVAIPAQSLSTFPIVLGQEAGIYARHGINLSMVTMASNAAIAGLIGGSVDYATPAGSIMRAINQGAPLRVVAAVSDKSNHILVVD